MIGDRIRSRFGFRPIKFASPAYFLFGLRLALVFVERLSRYGPAWICAWAALAIVQIQAVEVTAEMLGESFGQSSNPPATASTRASTTFR